MHPSAKLPNQRRWKSRRGMKTVSCYLMSSAESRPQWQHQIELPTNSIILLVLLFLNVLSVLPVTLLVLLNTLS